MKLCTVDGCEQKHHARGYCRHHYERLVPKQPKLPVFRSESTCKIDGCDRPHVGRGMCQTHYQRWYQGRPLGGNPTGRKVGVKQPRPKRPDKGCTVEGCTRKHQARGFCNVHERRNRLYGNPLGGAPERKRYGPDDVCSVDGCNERPQWRGMCKKHGRADNYQKTRGKYVPGPLLPEESTLPQPVPDALPATIADGWTRPAQRTERRARVHSGWLRTQSTGEGAVPSPLPGQQTRHTRTQEETAPTVRGQGV